jgi:hypothetical protein
LTESTWHSAILTTIALLSPIVRMRETNAFLRRCGSPNAAIGGGSVGLSGITVCSLVYLTERLL